MYRTTVRVSLILWFNSMALAGPFTLPFKNQNTPLWQGWTYTDGNYHGAIDFGCSCGTEIVAVADGWASAWYQPYDPNGGGYSWGEYVLMYHPSCNCYTISTHLSQQLASIPYNFQTQYHPGGSWVWIKAGEIIGWAGATGTSECHLHFEIGTDGLPNTTNRRDPYGLYAMAPSYPGCGDSGSNYYYWKDCPPKVPEAQFTCGNPGPFVDIAKAGDFDGNGKKEPIRFYKGPGKWDAMLSNGTKFLPLSQWFCGLGIDSEAQMVGDINGDKRTDLVVLQNNAYGDIYVATSTGGKFNDYYNAGNGLMKNMTNRFVGDVDGNGREDLIGWANGKWYVSLGNGFTFGPQALVRSDNPGSTKRMVGDVNGDGRVDLIIFFSWGTWWVALGQSNGTFSSFTVWETGHGVGASDWFVADIGGDKKADAICFWKNTGTVVVHDSTGSSFDGTDDPRAIGHGTNSQKQLFGDFTGDGKADFGFWYASGDDWRVSKSDGWGFLVPTQW
ncbi:MAG: FG-GAP-like repeat-containing protein [Candidatus Andersenbacteria bacterium]